jgi:hypothetical protein
MDHPIAVAELHRREQLLREALYLRLHERLLPSLQQRRLGDMHTYNGTLKVGAIGHDKTSLSVSSLLCPKNDFSFHRSRCKHTYIDRLLELAGVKLI